MKKLQLECKKLGSGILNFWGWVKSNPLMVVITFVVFFLSFYKLMFNTHFYQDAGATILSQGSNYNWLDIGRFGLVFVRAIFGTNNTNPYFEAALFFVALTITGLVWGYFLNILTEKKNSIWLSILFAIIFLTYPTFTDQYYFQFQSFEMVLGNLFVVISLILLYVGARDWNWLFIILSIPVAILAFGIYQSFVPVFITGCIGMYLISLKKDVRFKDTLKTIGTYLLAFLIAFGIYELLCKLFFTSGDYISNQIAWGNMDILDIKDNLNYYIRSLILGRGSFFTPSYMIVGILMLLTLLYIINFYWDENKTYIVISIIISIMLLLSPLMLTLLTGTPTLNRAQLALPLMIGLGLMFVINSFDSVKVLKYILLLVGFGCCLVQINSTLRISYTYDVISENDRVTATKLSYDLDKIIANNGDMPIAFIGTHEASANAAACDTHEWSYLFDSSLMINSTMEPYYYWGTMGMTDYYKMIGINYTNADENQIAIATEYAREMPIWPADNSIQIKDGIIIVKMSYIE